MEGLINWFHGFHGYSHIDFHMENLIGHTSKTGKTSKTKRDKTILIPNN